MPTIALQEIPLVARIEESGIALWKLYFLTAAAGWLMSALMSPAAYLVNPDSLMAEGFTFELMFIKLFLNWSLVAFTVFCCIALARTTETDLQQLAQVDETIQSTFEHLRPNKETTVMLMVSLVLVIVLFSPIVHMSTHGVSFLTAVERHLEAGLGPAVVLVLMPIVLGCAVGLAIAIVVSQIKTLLKVAREIHLDLFGLEDYTPVASPLIRYIIIVLFVFSGIPLVLLFGNERLNEALDEVAVLFLIVYAPILMGYFSPVLVLRNRIRDAKLTALSHLRSARSVGETPTESLWPATHQPVPDLLTQQMFIESRWEWPIAPQIQKLMLFGMLPPLTWVMAALVENILF